MMLTMTLFNCNFNSFIHVNNVAALHVAVDRICNYSTLTNNVLSNMRISFTISLFFMLSNLHDEQSRTLL